MFRIQHKAAAMFLAGVMAFASPAAAFAAQQSSVSVPAHIRVVTRTAEKKEDSSLQFDAIRFFDFSYNDDIDRKIFMKRLEDALAACTQAGKGSETQVKEMSAIVKALGKFAKDIKKAKVAAEETAFSEETLMLLARISYAQERTASVRKDYKRLLKSAQKAEQEELARKAQEEEAARIAAERAAAQRAAAAEAAAAAATAANEASYSQTASNAQAAQALSAEGTAENTAYQQERAGYVEASKGEDSSYDNASQTYYDQEADSAESTSSDENTEEAGYENDTADVSGENETLEENEEPAEDTESEESVSYVDEEDSEEAGYEEDTTSYTEDEEDAVDEEDADDEEDDDESEESPTPSSGLKWPVSSTSIASDYGEREAPMEGASTYHEGIDIDAAEGEDISAAAAGTVTEAGYNDAMGNYVVIDHGDGLSTTYEHCSDIYTEEGASVSQGETIAAVGSTGIATGSHLHFGVSVDGESVDPTDYSYEY